MSYDSSLSQDICNTWRATVLVKVIWRNVLGEYNCENKKTTVSSDSDCGAKKVWLQELEGNFGSAIPDWKVRVTLNVTHLLTKGESNVPMIGHIGLKNHFQKVIWRGCNFPLFVSRKNVLISIAHGTLSTNANPIISRVAAFKVWEKVDTARSGPPKAWDAWRGNFKLDIKW